LVKHRLIVCCLAPEDGLGSGSARQLRRPQTRTRNPAKGEQGSESPASGPAKPACVGSPSRSGAEGQMPLSPLEHGAWNEGASAFPERKGNLMRLLRFRTRGIRVKDGQASGTPGLARSTPGNALICRRMDSRRGDIDFGGKRLAERTPGQAKPETPPGFYLIDMQRLSSSGRPSWDLYLLLQRPSEYHRLRPGHWGAALSQPSSPFNLSTVEFRFYGLVRHGLPTLPAGLT
jgi:hypothetical protein